MKHTAQCFAAHMGIWAIDATFLRQATSAIKAGMWTPPARGDQQTRIPLAAAPVFAPGADPAEAQPLYLRTDGGVALIEISGGMMKTASKYGGTSTVSTRQSIRAAAQDPETIAIQLIIDSPGGTVSGTQALGDDIRAADALKPVHAHIEDLGASAAYWVASQARRVTSNRSALIGSLGTFGVIEDSSEQAKMEGIKVHVISTGPQKGAFVDGAPVKPEQLAEYQKMVDSLNALFMQAVSVGRRMPMDSVAAMFDGTVHIASKAKDMGLIDGIQGLDQSIAETTAAGQPAVPPATGGTMNRRLAIARARQ